MATEASATVVEKRSVPWLRIVVGIVLAVVALMLPFTNNAENNQIFSQVLYLAIAAMGLNLLTGFNGQVSIGHGAFFGLGAFTTAKLMTDQGMAFEMTIVIAAVLAAVLGVLVGFPALRVKGSYLALITLGLSVLFPVVTKRFIKGPGGIPFLQPKRSDFDSLITGLDRDQYAYFVCLVLAVALFAAAWSLVHSRAGRSMIAVRDQEIAASTVGINIAGVKVTTFALSAAYAGVAGSLSVMVDGGADASNVLLYFQKSIEFLIAVVVGGTATISGPLLGAILLTFIRRRTSGTEAMAPALLGGALILVIFILPDGIVGGLKRLTAKVKSSRAQPSQGPNGAAKSPTMSTN
ncbi:MAG: branched-chain amino acid ABC transporter permease [Acidimicrobiales bacterium]|nr:branched-chain amino acid ABC transporter permease [Acidimicrobiales bacterium]